MSDVHGRPEPAAFNPVFSRFHDDSPQPQRLRGLVAYGLYKIAKREWAAGLGRPPSADELAAYVRTWTPSQLEGKVEQAENILSEYADNVVEAATPDIEKRALRGSWPRAIGYGIAANLIYTLFLIAVLIVLRINGVDLLGLAEKIGGR